MKSRPFVIATAIVCLYFLPFVISWENSNITIHDNLDNNVVRYVILDRENKLFTLNPNAEVDAMMGGLPRMMFPTGWSILAILYFIFSPFVAYLINFLLVHTIAFAGMRMLLKRHFLADPADDDLVAFAALCFALIPFYTIYGLSVAGTPLLLWAFMNLAKGKKTKYDYPVIVVFALYSSLMLVGIFAIACFLVWGLYNYIQTRVIRRSFALGLLTLTGVYVVGNFMTFHEFFFSDTVSHRVEFAMPPADFSTVVNEALHFFAQLHYHVSSPLHILLVISLGAIVVGLATRHPHTRFVILLLLGNLVIAFIYSVYNWELLEPLWNGIPFTKQFQWNRFYFLSPLIWFLAFAWSLKIVKDATQANRVYRFAALPIGFGILFFIWKHNVEFRETTSNLFASKKTGWSYKQFYDEKLFSEIKAFIGKPVSTYRVASVGMHPAVSLYNGMRTIDGYLPSYPLAYKKEFRKIIAGELDKASHLKEYFDNWGSRCYLFSSELSHNFTVEKESNIRLTNISYDLSEGPRVDYILSAAEIVNAADNQLQLLRTFELQDSRWKIFLYKVQQQIKVAVNALVVSDDMFKLYFVPEGSQAYAESYSTMKIVYGKKEYQEVTFFLPDSVAISRMRLDVGVDPNQKLLSIKEVRFGYGDREFSISTDKLQPNEFIIPGNGDFRLQKVGDRYDPYFELDPASVANLRELMSVSNKH